MLIKLTGNTEELKEVRSLEICEGRKKKKEKHTTVKMHTFSKCEPDFAIQRKTFNEMMLRTRADLCIAGVRTEVNILAVKNISNLQFGCQLRCWEPFWSLLKWETGQ